MPTPGLGSSPLATGTQPVTDRSMETSSVPNPEPECRLPGAGAQLSTDRHRKTPRTSSPGRSSVLEKVERLWTTDRVTETTSMHTKADKKPEL